MRDLCTGAGWIFLTCLAPNFMEGDLVYFEVTGFLTGAVLFSDFLLLAGTVWTAFTGFDTGFSQETYFFPLWLTISCVTGKVVCFLETVVSTFRTFSGSSWNSLSWFDHSALDGGLLLLNKDTVRPIGSLMHSLRLWDYLLLIPNRADISMSFIVRTDFVSIHTISWLWVGFLVCFSWHYL